MKLVFCTVILVFAATVNSFAPSVDDDSFPDYWSNEGDYDEYAENVGVDENIDVKADETSTQLEAELEDFKDLQNIPNEDAKYDSLVDYQFEDNRSNTDDKDAVKENSDVPNIESVSDDILKAITDIAVEAPEDDIFDDVNKSDIPEVEVEKEPLQKSQESYEAKIENLGELSANKPLNEELAEENSDLVQMIEDTSKVSNENNENLKADDNDVKKKVDEQLLENNDDNDETPEDVLDDLNDDLEKLLETLDKLSDNDSELDDDAKKVESIDDVQDYEEKYDRPYKEGNILSLRDDYDNFDDSNLADIFAANAEIVGLVSKEEDNSKKQIKNVSVGNKQSETTKPVDQVDENAESIENSEDELDEFNYSDELEKLISSFDDSEESEKVNDLIDVLLKHSYGNDGLEDDNLPINRDAEIISTTVELNTENTTENPDTEAMNTEKSPSTVMVDDLNSSEYKDLMAQFAFAHSEDLDVKSKGFIKNVAPIHITLSVDEPTIITSPDYPGLYPTNNIVDWIFEGPGMGIEMNITHFEVNGVAGDYLLVKPGGVDASGTDGLIFSFRLTSERRYRFTNVNRMFVRFESKEAQQFFNGFSFSARMIWPLPEIGVEDIPEPEAVLHPPRETLILSLAGLTLPQFENIKPEFKTLVADMAEQYIKDNDIYPGLNTTLEVTQITRVAICNIRWPNYETCVEVSFGVPLHYEEEPEKPRLNLEDLDAMWRTYIVKEQFASRLREMGITEYAIPNDRTILMVWLVIALGVIISMAMLVFALWRFSCFEDYTRMRTFNDSDSVQNEKRNLDLYPTPHQTLPPLYSENDYKWVDDKYNDSTRVDLGGFTNKSYARDNLFDFDSDEDIIPPQDRKRVISPSDVYEV